MQKLAIISTVIMALILMGCPPPVSNNPVSGDPDPQPKAIVVKQVSAGGSHTMILKTNGSLWAVGWNKYGQLGNGNGGDGAMELTPAQVMIAGSQPVTEVDRVSTGETHTMILKENGDLWAVGRNTYGQLGNGDETRVNKLNPVQVKTDDGEPITNVLQVSAGQVFTMILKENGELWAFGSNNVGELGNGAETRDIKLNPVQVMIAEDQAMTNVVQVAAGGNHSMILKKNGELWAVGHNNKGQLGDGSTQNKYFAIQVKQTNPEGGDPIPMIEVDSVSAADDHSMILKKNGELWAVGSNAHGQLGDGSNAKKTIPVQVKTADGEPMTNVLQVSTGKGHSMIIKNNGELWAVGLNDHGQLGDGTTDNKKNPVQVKQANPAGGDPIPMIEVASVSAGDTHTIILKKDDTLWAAGWNQYGQLGDSTGGSADAVQLIPVEIAVP